MTTLLHSLGVNDDDIKTEEFGDYKLGGGNGGDPEIMSQGKGR